MISHFGVLLLYTMYLVTNMLYVKATCNDGGTGTVLIYLIMTRLVLEDEPDRRSGGVVHFPSVLDV